jgi:hypothetical protein
MSCTSPLVSSLLMGRCGPLQLFCGLGLHCLCFLCMPPFSMDGCGRGVLFFVGLSFFISGGFYFARLSFSSCADSFCVLPLTTWGSFPFIALSSFVIVTFSWVWIPLFPCGVFFSLFGVPFSRESPCVL